MQLRIVFFLLVMLALPFVLGDGAPSSSVTVSGPAAMPTAGVVPKLPGTGDQWLDFGRTVIGTLVGATAAFLFNLWLQHLARRRENLAAGNLAMLVLSRQFSDTLILKRGTEENQVKALKGDASAPLWAQVKPTHFYFPPTLTFNFDSLSFLFSTESRTVMSRLAQAEQLYFDLDSLVQRHADTLEELQRKLSDRNLTHESWEVIDMQLGPELIGKANTLTEGLLGRLKRNPDDYTRAIQELRAGLVAIFPEEKVVKISTEVVRLPAV
jgi:hypothetical protein